jgi:hypothetical protein
MHNDMTRAARLSNWTAELWRGLCDYFGSIGRRRVEPIIDPATLREFLETRASYVAQTSLYGYLRTRAGQLYPQLFDNDEYVQSINVAKWYMWLACLSDLVVYAGGLLNQRSKVSPDKIDTLMQGVVDRILENTGTPAEAGDDFAAQAERVRTRVTGCNWADICDDETSFSESPVALVRWAPVVDTLKELDEEIVNNSVRFRWQEVRRDLREHLDAEAVLRSSD